MAQALDTDFENFLEEIEAVATTEVKNASENPNPLKKMKIAHEEPIVVSTVSSTPILGNAYVVASKKAMPPSTISKPAMPSDTIAQATITTTSTSVLSETGPMGIPILGMHPPRHIQVPLPLPNVQHAGLATQAHFDQQQSAYNYDPSKKTTNLMHGSITATTTSAHGTSGDVDAEEEEVVDKKRKRTTRYAAGQLWEDKTLDEWPDNDYRIFIGDLGSEATDEMLSACFNKYTSFNRAKVIINKRKLKNRGYGFVSFLDPFDCMKAMREMNGKFCGNRPMKIKKSEWHKKDVKVAKKRMKGAKKLAKIAAGAGKNVFF